MLANELIVCSVIFIPIQENRSRLFYAMVCGQRTSTIRQMPAIPASGAPLSITLWVRLGTMHMVALWLPGPFSAFCDFVAKRLM